MDGLQDDGGDGMMCTEHPFKNTTPAGGICAFCLQEKLGKLVSSSFPITVFPSSSSSSPSFRSSDIVSGGGHISISNTSTGTGAGIITIPAPAHVSTTSINMHTNTSGTNGNGIGNEYMYGHQKHYASKSRISYLLSQKKKKKKDHTIILDGSNNGNNLNNNIMFKRSKSTATNHFLDDDSPNKRGFWSYLLHQKSSKSSRSISSNTLSASYQNPRSQDMIIVEENESPNQPSFDRKVSRSRSVGCGSRSFSGDFFEKISTGFGDCTLRRVESQRAPRARECVKERVRCGGLFSGFTITSSSSSSSSSSYWVAAAAPSSNPANNSNTMTSAGGQHHHGRSKSWGWALASPMRAFSKTSSTKSKNQTPNLSAIPSLLSVRN